MRLASIALTLALSACASARVSTLVPADAATTLITGDRVTMRIEPPVSGGEDPLILMSLTHADGRVMRFQEANHAPYHLLAQAPGGPLAQVMGHFGGERPTLYGFRSEQSQDAPFLCPPDGPVSVGVFASDAGGVQIVGLKQDFQFEPRGDGSYEALPYSPDQVCARLRFTKGQ